MKSMMAAGILLSLDKDLDRNFQAETEFIAGELRPQPLGTDHHSNICSAPEQTSTLTAGELTVSLAGFFREE